MKTGMRLLVISGLFLLLIFSLVFVWICGGSVLPQITDDIMSGMYYRSLAEENEEMVMRNEDGLVIRSVSPLTECGCNCWLRIEGTDIDYPVMQESSSSKGYYLNHRPDGKMSRSGSLYIPYYDSADSDNVIIYGHHMRNGSMFGGLNDYKDRRWAGSHRKIELTTDEGIREYEVVSVLVMSLTDRDHIWEEKLVFDDTGDKKRYLKRVMELSSVDMGSQPDIKTGTRFITLVTCDYSVPDGRLVIVAAG